MTVQSATFTFALPDDALADRIYIYSSTTENGTYTLVTSAAYLYGTTQYLFATLDTTLWYTINFLNTGATTFGPLSDPVYGGNYSSAAPFLVISSTSDGANYATTEDVYDYSDLTAADIEPEKVSKALRSARAMIDFRTASMNFQRFSFFTTEIARRKYNAVLRIIWEAEINIALSNVYTNLSDDVIIENKRSGALGSGTLTVGGTSISADGLSERTENIVYLSTLAARYQVTGYRLLSSIDTNAVVLISGDPNELIYGPRFRMPNPGYYYAGQGGSLSGYF